MTSKQTDSPIGDGRLAKLQDPATIGADLHLTGQEPWRDAHHRLDKPTVLALQSALAARRPLLIRGEPGIGKSQIARAAAHVLKVPFLYTVVNASCDCRDLLYADDPVARLAQAQVLGHGAALKPSEDWPSLMAPKRFVTPRALWWGFNWQGAQDHCKDSKVECPVPKNPTHWKRAEGCVVLIDEIDKADTDLPNGLLESLDSDGFQVPGSGMHVARDVNQGSPLVIITTNEHRELPAAFLRRCLVLHLEFPKDPEKAKAFLIERAQAHFREFVPTDKVLKSAAKQLLEDRDSAAPGQARPGAAEYLDLIRALNELAQANEKKQIALLKDIRRYFFVKEAR